MNKVCILQDLAPRIKLISKTMPGVKDFKSHVNVLQMTQFPTVPLLSMRSRYLGQLPGCDSSLTAERRKARAGSEVVGR